LLNQALIVDLSDVSFLDDTIALTIENLIKDAQDLDTQVVMVVKQPRTKEKLMHLGFENLLGDADFVYDRTQALTLAHKKLHHAGGVSVA
jgi:SulP family sulfate permease